MFWRCLWLAACLALTTGNALAQQRIKVGGPEGTMLTIGPIGPRATVESVTAQLSEALANYDNGGISIREGLVRRGDEIATRAISYDDVRRLGNDVSRSGALGGRVLLLRAGAPLYSHENINADVVFLNGRARVQRLWCGANGSNGYCLVRRQSGWEAAEVRSYSAYSPMSLGTFVPVTDAQLETDQTASAELPTRTEVYRLAGTDRARATIARSIRIGDDTFDIDEIQAKQMRLGSLMVQIEPGPESGSATIRFVALIPPIIKATCEERREVSWTDPEIYSPCRSNPIGTGYSVSCMSVRPPCATSSFSISMSEKRSLMHRR